MKRQIFALGLTFVFAGCATQNLAGTSSYQAVPTERNSSVFVEPEPGRPAGTIIVKRDLGMFGAGLSSILLVGGKPVVQLKPGEYFQFRVVAGEQLLGVAWSDNFGAVETSSTREIAVDVHPGQTYYFRMLPQAGNGIVIERSSQ